jgi:predicted ATPase
MVEAQRGVENGLEKSLRAAMEHRGQLFGRDIQAAELLEAYRRVQANSAKRRPPRETENENLDGRSELVVIQGSSGTGKTALAHAIQSLVEKEDGGYFVRVSFDAVEGSKPYQALLEALMHFVERTIERGDG